MDAHACHQSFQVLSKAGSLSKQCANNDILSKKMKSEWLHVGDTGKYWGASRLFGVSVSISRELSWINCVIVHTETTYCDTHTHAGMYMHTYIAVITVFPRGISLLGGCEEGCCNTTSFLFSFSFLSTFVFLQHMHIQEFVSPLFSNYSASWLTLSLPASYSALLHCLSPQATFFHSGRYIQSLTSSKKPMEIDVCSEALWGVTWHDGEFSLSFVQQQLFCHMSDVLPALWNPTNIPPVSRLL